MVSMIARSRWWFRVLGAGLLSLWLLTPALGEQRQLTLGIFAFRPQQVLEVAYQPLVDHLNARVPDAHVRLQVLSQADMAHALQRGELDLVFTNPSHFVLLRSQSALTGAIATLVRLDGDQPVSELGGVIFTTAGHSDIQSLADLKGRVLAIPGKHFLGGYQTQALELLRAGVRIPNDFSAVREFGSHDNVVKAVLAGEADVGFVRTSILETMAQEGALDIADVRVINPQSGTAFPFRTSTRLYPEWAFAAVTERVGDRLERRLAAALLEIEPDSRAARAAGIFGFTVPADYRSVDELARVLRLAPYEKGPNFTVRDAMTRWRWQIWAGLLAMALILALSLLLFQAYRRLQRQQARERLHMAALGEGVYGVDVKGRCTFVNPAALSMLGYAEADLLGSEPHAMFHHSSLNGEPLKAADCPINRCLRDGVPCQLDEWFVRKDGTGFCVSLTATPMAFEGQPLGAVVAFQDITGRKALEQQLTEMATIDALTGLPNRRHFLSRIKEELARIQRRPQEPAALLMLDLDHFKRVNDTHGHAAGDAVLRHFATLIQTDIREGDLAGRIGGEEFAIVMPGASLESAMARADRLRERVAAAPVAWEGVSIVCTVSIGVTPLTPLDNQPAPALARADEALYRAKNRRNCVSA